MNKSELRTYVRFQLSQLGARNGAHEFERLCFDLARLRLVSNILPATGPVQSGGDGGRDFESYRTYLAGSPGVSCSFLALATDDMVVGACTLQQKDINAKVRADLASIFGQGERPQRVIYFCEVAMPVAHRHKLQAHCRAKYDALLDIHDGEAIADQLSDADTFWIASQHLAVPAEMYPQDDEDEVYAALRKRWLTEQSTPSNYADFLEIKAGLREATRVEAAMPDILQWLGIMRAYADAPPSLPMAQKARYEVAVAELRGRGNLDPALPLLELFFRDVAEGASAAVDLLDAAVLLVFAWGATKHGHTTLEEARVEGWAGLVSGLIARAQAQETRRGELCTLLEADAMLAGVNFSNLPVPELLDRSFAAWSKVIDQAASVPHYPLDHVADLMDILAPVGQGRPAYRPLLDRIDAIVQQRSGSAAAAARAFKRAQSHIEREVWLPAIDELQRAKVGWWSGDQLELALRVKMMLSECYGRLGLHLAARYYAGGGAYVAIHSSDETLRALTPEMALGVADTFFANGEGLSGLEVLGQALGLRLALKSSNAASEMDESLSQALYHATMFRVIVRRLAPELEPLVDDILGRWPMNRADIDHYLDIALAADSPWTQMTIEEIRTTIDRDVGRSPFSDVGPVRTSRWAALGVDWVLQHSANAETSAAALGLGALIQILQVELAGAELLVIPTKATILVETADIPEVVVRDEGGEGLQWRVILPCNEPADAYGQEPFHQALAVATTILGQVTALNVEGLGEVIEMAFRRDLPLRAYSVRPSTEIMAFTQAQIAELDRFASAPPIPWAHTSPVSPPELGWPETAGPGYTEERARLALENRYRRPWETAGLSLPLIFANPQCRSVLLQFRAEGYKDWQLLGAVWSMVCQTQVQPDGKYSQDLPARFRARVSRAERQDDLVFDLALITAERLRQQLIASIPAAFSTWRLSVNRPDIDHEAMKRLLDVRYRQSTDDIPHDDFLPAA